MTGTICFGRDAHCNNIKSDKYEPILDCTKRSVEQLIAFRKKGYFGAEEKLEFTPLVSDDEEVEQTVSLLEDVYYGTTPQKKIEAQIIRKNLRKNLSKFKEYVREYQEAEDAVEKDDIGELLKRELNNSSEFTAFKRWLIWDNEMFSEIEKYIPKKIDFREIKLVLECAIIQVPILNFASILYCTKTYIAVSFLNLGLGTFGAC